MTRTTVVRGGRRCPCRGGLRLREHGGGGGRVVALTSPSSRREVQADGRGVKRQVDVATIVGGGVQVSPVVQPK